MSLFTSDRERWLWFSALAVTVVGVLQWLVLRRQIPRSGWWVLASTVGWAVGMPLGDINGPPGPGAAYGAITGTALVWLLRQGPPGSVEHQRPSPVPTKDATAPPRHSRRRP